MPLHTYMPLHNVHATTYLIATLNEIPDSVLAEVQNLSQKQFIDRARQGILAQYSDTCAIHNCYVCKI